jgi:hypothetical protein
MICTQARRLFGAYWDDETTQAERECLESHFASCPACRSEYEQYARALELMARLPRVEAAPDFAERVLSRTRRAATVHDRVPAPSRRWVPATAVAALATLALVVILPWAGLLPGFLTARHEAPVNLRQPVLAEHPAGAVRAPVSGDPAGAVAERHAAVRSERLAAVSDSLFDHSEDVEFILDPVVLRKGRAHAVSRLSPEAQGEQATISF